jgi:hypothetical protein
MRIGLPVAVALSGKARLIGDSALCCHGFEDASFVYRA